MRLAVVLWLGCFVMSLLPFAWAKRYRPVGATATTYGMSRAEAETQLYRVSRSPQGDMRLKVIIAGGGIAGMAAALLLERHGLRPVIVERSHTPSNDVGAGLNIVPKVILASTTRKPGSVVGSLGCLTKCSSSGGARETLTLGCPGRQGAHLQNRKGIISTAR